MNNVNSIYLFICLRQSLTVAQAGVQRCNLSSLQPPPPGFKQFSTSAVWVARITGVCHHAWLIFCIFNRDGLSPCWSVWSWTINLRWSAHLGLPKHWDYRHESPCLAKSILLSNIIFAQVHLSYKKWVSECVDTKIFQTEMTKLLMQVDYWF